MKNKHQLKTTLTKLKDLRDADSLSNLPTHFFETLGECINEIEEFIGEPKNQVIPGKKPQEQLHHTYKVNVRDPYGFDLKD